MHFFSSFLNSYTSFLPQSWHSCFNSPSCPYTLASIYTFIFLYFFCLILPFTFYFTQISSQILCSLFSLFANLHSHLRIFYAKKSLELDFCKNSLFHSHLTVFATWPCNTGSLISVVLLWGCWRKSHSAAGTVFLVLGSMDSPQSCSGSWKYESVINDAVSCWYCLIYVCCLP